MKKNATSDKHVHVLVIGAGISGIGAGIRMLKEHISDFIILEKSADLGGTWRDNTYPGCECDVPSALYSYSFFQKPDWSKTFAGQPEILDYVHTSASHYGIQQFIRFNQEVIHSQWNESEKQWTVQTKDHCYTADFVISCGGYLHEPIVPDIPGLEDFPGTLFHSSRWDHQHNLNGERVAVIGTGASAIQFVPEIQPKVARLSLFQRTPQWVLPKPDGQMPELGKRFFSLPFTLNAWRQVLYSGFEAFGIGFRHPRILEQLQKIGEAHLRLTIKDPLLRKKLTPQYTLGCKRMLLSNHYYPAVAQENVELFACGVKEIQGNRVIGQDGSSAEVDTIILGTGFFVTEPPIADVVHDGKGVSLRQRWQNGMQAYKGTVVHGLPNAFMVLGPNLGIGHNSAFVVIESQLDYIISALKQIRQKRLSRIEVKANVQNQYNRMIQEDLQHTVWNTGGCSSYYLDKNGFNSVGFPWSTLKMKQLLKRCDMDSFDTEYRVPRNSDSYTQNSLSVAGENV